MRFFAPYMVLLLLGILQCKHEPNQPFKGLYTQDGDPVNLYRDSSVKGYVFYFLQPDCPFSQFYTFSINQVYSIFSRRGYVFYGVAPGTLYTGAELDSFVSRYGLLPPLLRDPESVFTQSMQVRVVPQAIFTDRKGTVLYSGKLDDRAIGPGQKKVVAQSYYLLNAIKQHEAGTEITVKKTEATGCYLENE